MKVQVIKEWDKTHSQFYYSVQVDGERKNGSFDEGKAKASAQEIFDNRNFTASDEVVMELSDEE
jgi:hypothetical protein